MKRKKFILFSLCLCLCLCGFCFSGVFLGNKNFVKAVDYNLADFSPDTLRSLYNAEITFLDTGFIVSVRTIPVSDTANARFNYALIPNTEYILTYSAEKLVEGSHNRVIVRNSNNAVLKTTVDGNSVIFTTDSTGTGVFEFFAFYEWGSSIDKIYKTKYFDITLRFADEQLGAVYEQGYDDGYNDGLTGRDVREWIPVELNDLSSTPPELVYFDADSRSNPPTMPSINGINPFGRAIFRVIPGTYRITFVNELSGFYPLVYDFEGLIYKSRSFRLITPICTSVLAGDVRVDALSLDVFNLDNSPYTFEDALARRPIVFSVPSSLASGEKVTLNIYMMKLDSSLNFVAWENNETYDYDELFTIDMLEPTSSYNQGYVDGYDVGFRDGKSSGYNEGYETGYNTGYNVGVSNSISTNWFISFINSVFNILNIEIFPNVRLIYLIFIPIGLGVLALIFKLIRG